MIANFHITNINFNYNFVITKLIIFKFTLNLNFGFKRFKPTFKKLLYLTNDRIL